MEIFTQFIFDHSGHAHIIIFCLLMLAGVNVPLSEDLLLLFGGVIAGTFVPDHAIRMYLWIYVGCILSGWEAYCLGRFLGPKLYKYKLFSYILTSQRIDRLNTFYEKYGIWTFLLGRFCPGGVRNALFITSGLGKMPFLLFVIRDTIACSISSLTLFWLGYEFGEHWHTIVEYVKAYQMILSGILALIGLVIGSIIWYKNREKMRTQNVDAC